MPWNEHTQRLLETIVFKGKIIERKKGRGGLVYIVEQDALPKRVAYKTIQEFESNLAVNTERIDREARNWLGFAGHPLIIRPHFIEVWEGFPLICMPYCDGDLSQLIGKNLSLTSVVCLSVQIVKGMMAANKYGMDHHQDVKPENLLYINVSTKFPGFPPPAVDPSLKYSVRIADFGVANARHEGYLGGTNAYKAPEQHDSSLYAEFAPDVFGVGLVIAELLQGYHPAAKDTRTKVRKWRGSKLKKWSIGGTRHFSPTQNPRAQDLINLIEQMLSADPSARPSFNQCYDRLTSILKVLSFNSLKQLELLFSYFDYIASWYGLESEIDMRLKLAEIPSQRRDVQTSIRKQLRDTLKGGMSSLESVLRGHHFAEALYRICGQDRNQHDTDLLIEASRNVIEFILGHHDCITADCLWPSFSFGDTKPKKQGSDIEAKAEILNINIERLKLLHAYDEQLQENVNEGGNVICACRILAVAQERWVNWQFAEACKLLKQVMQLTPYEPELESLYELWTRSRDALKNSHLSKETRA